MNGFLCVLAAILILAFIIMSCFGFWYFVNSKAAEAQAWEIAESVSGGIALLGKGIFIVLIAGSFFLVGHGIRAGAEPLSRSIGTYLLAKTASRNMLPNSGIEMPDIRIWPPVEPQLSIPDLREIPSGGDGPHLLT